MQFTNNVLLVKPARFGFNEQTAPSNAFQKNIHTSFSNIAEAIKEFDRMQLQLSESGINTLVIEDSKDPIKPDAVFPNNWISLHKNGTIILYPMEAVNRRWERRPEIIDILKNSFEVNQVIDFSNPEEKGKYLEGTGSIVFDHQNNLAYAAISTRTDKQLFDELCALIKYKGISFHSFDANRKPIYHTNVMMCIGNKFSAICLETISDSAEKALVRKSLEDTNHEVIEITMDQMKKFAGNMLQLQNKEGKYILALSNSAYEALSNDQKNKINHYTEMLPLKIPTIETIGGGSVRCMIAENFLPEKSTLTKGED